MGVFAAAVDDVTGAEVVVVFVVVDVCVDVAVEVAVDVTVVCVPDEQEESTKAANSKQLNPNHKMFFFTYFSLLYFSHLVYLINFLRSLLLPPFSEVLTRLLSKFYIAHK